MARAFTTPTFLDVPTRNTQKGRGANTRFALGHIGVVPMSESVQRNSDEAYSVNDSIIAIPWIGRCDMDL